MIFLTVGHQSPFDRLVECVDRWAAANPQHEVIAQIGSGRYVPQNLTWTRWLSPDEFESRLDECLAVVAHAGTGTILQVLLKQKPLLVLPRLADLGETRNDHQIGTARHFAEEGYLMAAHDEATLECQMASIIKQGPPRTVQRAASPELLSRISGFIGCLGESKTGLI